MLAGAPPIGKNDLAVAENFGALKGVRGASIGQCIGNPDLSSAGKAGGVLDIIFVK